MYSKEFKKKCKEIYPDLENLHRLLDEDAYIVGRYLDDGSYSYVSNDEILEATSLEELKEKAWHNKAKLDLYNEWCDIVKEY